MTAPPMPSPGTPSPSPTTSRLYAQRRHILSSLDLLTRQFLVINYLLSPSLFFLFCRFVAQIQCVRPRTIDSSQSLRFFWAISGVCNAPAIYSHVRYGVAEGKAVVLDFVGLLYTPSKGQILLLDFILLFLQLLITTLSYEIHTAQFTQTLDERDALFPPRSPSPLPSSLDEQPLFSHHEHSDDDEHEDTHTHLHDDLAFASNFGPAKPPPHHSRHEEGDFVLDLRIQTVLQRLRMSSAPSEGSSSSSASRLSSLLPLPNTTRASTGSGPSSDFRTSASMRRPVSRGSGFRSFSMDSLGRGGNTLGGSSPAARGGSGGGAGGGRRATGGAGMLRSSIGNFLRSDQVASAARRRLLESLETIGPASQRSAEGPPRTAQERASRGLGGEGGDGDTRTS